MPLKTCKYCERQKRAASFPQHGGQMCLECRRARQKAHYKSSKKRQAGVVAAKKRRQARLHKYICDHLKEHPCVDCGEDDIVVLDFDHVRGIKVDSISNLIGYAGFDKIREEIKKCAVRCANCHRRKTARQHGWKYKVPYGAAPRKHK